MKFTPPTFLSARDLAVEMDTDEITDKQIVDAMVEEFGIDRKDAVRRLARLDYMQLIADEL